MPMHPTSPSAVVSAFAVAFAFAGAARADNFLFSGTHAIKFSHNGHIKEVSASNAAKTGVAIVNGKSGPLNTLQLTRPFAKLTGTALGTQDETGIDEIRFKGVRINPKLAGPGGKPGLFKPIRAAASGMTLMTLTRSTLPAAGTIRLCNVIGCPASVALKLTQTMSNFAAGPGVGNGKIVVNGMSGSVTGPTLFSVTG